MKAAVLTIGTEVTDGEITNTNASWLGSELTELGLRVCHHLSTPDDDQLILDALEWLDQTNDWIFVTGGLGPTTDDKTRELIARFCDQPLEYDESEWIRLEKLYSLRGLNLTEGHKHQCYFPVQAVKMSNPVGSALGFRCRKQNTQLVILPGPPRELKAVFAENVRSDLERLGLKTGVPKKWTLLGITESEAAEIVEKVFKEQDVELGYRASVPYVHIKVWFGPKSDQTLLTQRFLADLGDFVVAEDGRDPIQDLLDAIPKSFSVAMDDSYSQGILASRIFDQGAASESVHQIIRNHDFAGLSVEADFVLRLSRDGDQVVSSLVSNGSTSSLELTIPYRLDYSSFRARKYFSELAIQAWLKLIQSSTQ